jgi:hypothetical protein
MIQHCQMTIELSRIYNCDPRTRNDQNVDLKAVLDVCRLGVCRQCMLYLFKQHCQYVCTQCSCWTAK